MSSHKGSPGLPISFWIPLPPLSMNSVYQIIFSQRRTQMSPKARVWKMRCKQAIPAMRLVNGAYAMTVEFHHQWYYQNGKMRRMDLQNCLKVLIDAISEKWGIDDSRIWSLVVRKVDDEKTGMQVRMDAWEKVVR